VVEVVKAVKAVESVEVVNIVEVDQRVGTGVIDRIRVASYSVRPF
jgi:hypothetical protein